MLCQVWTTSGRKDLTIYRCPGFRMSYSDQVQSTFRARLSPPPISSLLRNSILAQRPRWAQEDMLLLIVLGELSSRRYTVTGSPERTHQTKSEAMLLALDKVLCFYSHFSDYLLNLKSKEQSNKKVYCLTDFSGQGWLVLDKIKVPKTHAMHTQW